MTSTTLRGGLRSLPGELAGAHVPRRSARGWLAPLLALAAAGLLAVMIALHGHEFIAAVGRALHANWRLVAEGIILEAASLGSYVLLQHRVVGGASSRLRLKDSYDITLAGTAATRLLPTAGLGGAAVTVWALRARGVRPAELTERLVAFLLLLYAVYMAALFGAGAAVAIGVIPVTRGHTLGLVGASLAAAVALLAVTVLVLPARVGRLLHRAAAGSGRLAATARLGDEHLPALRAALARAWTELRRPHLALLGAFGWWAFDVAVLTAMLHAFGVSLPVVAIVLAYFLGTMFNVLPLPGSLSGGLVGVLIALGAPAAGAIAAVLAYRAIAVWLPAVSGIASLASLRSSVADWREEESRGGATRTSKPEFAV
jgi:putative heme transporter